MLGGVNRGYRKVYGRLFVGQCGVLLVLCLFDGFVFSWVCTCFCWFVGFARGDAVIAALVLALAGL